MSKQRRVTCNMLLFWLQYYSDDNLSYEQLREFADLFMYYKPDKFFNLIIGYYLEEGNFNSDEFVKAFEDGEFEKFSSVYTTHAELAKDKVKKNHKQNVYQETKKYLYDKISRDRSIERISRTLKNK